MVDPAIIPMANHLPIEFHGDFRVSIPSDFIGVMASFGCAIGENDAATESAPRMHNNLVAVFMILLERLCNGLGFCMYRPLEVGNMGIEREATLCSRDLGDPKDTPYDTFDISDTYMSICEKKIFIGDVEEERG